MKLWMSVIQIIKKKHILGLDRAECHIFCLKILNADQNLPSLRGQQMLVMLIYEPFQCYALLIWKLGCRILGICMIVDNLFKIKFVYKYMC